MLPVLLHRVANATQHLKGLAALLAVDPGALGTRGRDLAETSDLVDDTGWLLALLASAQGSGLLLARRERRGLQPLVACVRDCLRRDGCDLREPDSPIPDLAPDVGDGWQLPWAIGSWLYASGRTDGPAPAWGFLLTPEGARLECRGAPPDLARSVERLAQALPGLAASSGGGVEVLRFPAGWLRDPR